VVEWKEDLRVLLIILKNKRKNTVRTNDNPVGTSPTTNVEAFD
jgi:hypothetical protein